MELFIPFDERHAFSVFLILVTSSCVIALKSSKVLSVPLHLSVVYGSDYWRVFKINLLFFLFMSKMIVILLYHLFPHHINFHIIAFKLLL